MISQKMNTQKLSSQNNISSKQDFLAQAKNLQKISQITKQTKKAVSSSSGDSQTGSQESSNYSSESSVQSDSKNQTKNNNPQKKTDDKKNIEQSIKNSEQKSEVENIIQDNNKSKVKKSECKPTRMRKDKSAKQVSSKKQQVASVRQLDKKKQQVGKAQTKGNNLTANKSQSENKLKNKEEISTNRLTLRKKNKINYNDMIQMNQPETPLIKIPYRRPKNSKKSIQAINMQEKKKEENVKKLVIKDEKVIKKQNQLNKQRQLNNKQNFQPLALQKIKEQEINHLVIDKPFMRTFQQYQKSNMCEKSLKIQKKVVVESIIVSSPPVSNGLNVITTQQIEEQFKKLRELFTHAPCCPFAKSTGNITKKKMVLQSLSSSEQQSSGSESNKLEKKSNLIKNNLRSDQDESEIREQTKKIQKKE